MFSGVINIGLTSGFAICGSTVTSGIIYACDSVLEFPIGPLTGCSICSGFAVGACAVFAISLFTVWFSVPFIMAGFGIAAAIEGS